MEGDFIGFLLRQDGIQIHTFKVGILDYKSLFFNIMNLF
jgi:hypothetical protein